MPSVFLVPCPAPLARCSVRFSRFRAAPPGPPRLPSGAGAPSSGEEVIYPHGRTLSRKTGDFFGSFFRSGAPGRARRGPELGKPGIIQCDGQKENELVKSISQPEFLNPELEIFLFAYRFEF